MKIELSQIQIVLLRNILKKEKAKLKSNRFEIFSFKTRREWEVDDIIKKLTQVKEGKTYEC